MSARPTMPHAAMLAASALALSCALAACGGAGEPADATRPEHTTIAKPTERPRAEDVTTQRTSPIKPNAGSAVTGATKSVEQEETDAKRTPSKDTETTDVTTGDATKARAADAGKTTRPKPGETIDKATIEALGGEDALFSAVPIPDDVFERMRGKSFGDDCTLARDDLRYLTTLYRNADGTTFVGEMVVATSVADEVLDIFHQLYDANWPIKRMVLVDEYDADDDASCADGNTAAFNFRPITGGSDLSMHAYGLAIDINTFENPYCKPSSGYVFPPEAARYADRSLDEPYMIHEGDLCWTLFTEHGWTWGGAWSEPIDYQHFEKN